MNLVHFLAAGVNGAASGTATFLLRGTASSAAAVLYSDFEGTAQPGTNVINLDSNGAAEVYVDAYVDVEIKNSSGVTLRTVTVGNSDSTTEVQSTSFTGTDYDGNPANTAGEPITLRALLNKWITSAGAADWQVMVDGVATNLDEAVAGFTGMFTNVKSEEFGATGDGVTDDTAAILAATTAAAGGVVFFPPGTYKIDTLSLSGANINWWGSGAGISIISGTTEATLIALTNNTNTGWKNFRNLSFTSSGTYDRLFLLEESQNVSFSHCAFDASECTADAIACTASAGLSKYLFNDCDFLFDASTSRGIYNQAAVGARHFSLSNCNFTVPSGFTGSILVGADFLVKGCRFDGSAVTSGVYRHIDAESATVAGKYVGVFSGNTFLDGGSGGFAFKLTGLGSACDFSEDGNTFVGFVAPSASAEKGHTYEITDAESGAPGDIHLGSRKGRLVSLTNADLTYTVSACLEAENVTISHTGTTGGIVYTVPALIPGLTGRVIVSNDSASGALSVNFRDSAALGTQINLDSGSDQAMTPNFGGSGNVVSCGYFTTAVFGGTFRSLITGELIHDV